MIWVISGTRDGREIGARLADLALRNREKPVFMTVVSSYGKELASHKGIEIDVGRYNKEQVVEIIHKKGIHLLVDASHPYAAQVTETAIKAAEETGIFYIRYERPESPLPPYEKLYVVNNEKEAAELAPVKGKKILLTTGSKTLADFSSLNRFKNLEVYTRVLPASGVIKKCEELGWNAGHILGMQGPFSLEFNRAMIRQYGIDVLIMKNSGTTGGSDTKLEAAIEEGITVIVVKRPQNDYHGLTVTHSVEETVSLASKNKNRRANELY